MYSGFIKSPHDERDIILDDNYKNSDKLPSSYNYAEYMNIKPKNQGKTYKCVPYSLSVMIECRKKLDGIDYEFDINDVYDNRDPKVDGMIVRDALKYMKNIGYRSKTNDNREKILTYGRLNSKYAIKSSVYVNGPCLIALPVYNSNETEFWKGNEYEGGHAVVCVGYDETGLILLNSWGADFGSYGQCILPYEEMNKIEECWTIL